MGSVRPSDVIHGKNRGNATNSKITLYQNYSRTTNRCKLLKLASRADLSKRMCRLKKFFTEPIYDLEKGTAYSSRFEETLNTSRIGTLLLTKWKILACVLVAVLGTLSLLSLTMNFQSL